MSIETGQYIIENVRFETVVYLPNDWIRTTVAVGAGQQNLNEKWNVNKLSNDRYTIKNVGTDTFAALGVTRAVMHCPVESWDRSQQWNIQETRVKGQFTIADTDIGFFWGSGLKDDEIEELSSSLTTNLDNEDDSPVRMVTTATDTRNWWVFKKVMS